MRFPLIFTEGVCHRPAGYSSSKEMVHTQRLSGFSFGQVRVGRGGRRVWRHALRFRGAPRCPGAPLQRVDGASSIAPAASIARRPLVPRAALSYLGSRPIPVRADRGLASGCSLSFASRSARRSDPTRRLRHRAWLNLGQEMRPLQHALLWGRMPGAALERGRPRQALQENKKSRRRRAIQRK